MCVRARVINRNVITIVSHTKKKEKNILTVRLFPFNMSSSR